MKTYYFPNIEHADAFFGSSDPVCVDHAELERLAVEWDKPLGEILQQVHEATADEIAAYGVYEK